MPFRLPRTKLRITHCMHLQYLWISAVLQYFTPAKLGTDWSLLDLWWFSYSEYVKVVSKCILHTVIISTYEAIQSGTLQARYSILGASRSKRSPSDVPCSRLIVQKVICPMGMLGNRAAGITAGKTDEFEKISNINAYPMNIQFSIFAKFVW